MKHIGNSTKEALLIDNSGVPILTNTDFGEPIPKGSIVIDKSNSDIYILNNSNNWSVYEERTGLIKSKNQSTTNSNFIEKKVKMVKYLLPGTSGIITEHIPNTIMEPNTQMFLDISFNLSNYAAPPTKTRNMYAFMRDGNNDIEQLYYDLISQNSSPNFTTNILNLTVDTSTNDVILQMSGSSTLEILIDYSVIKYNI